MNRPDTLAELLSEAGLRPKRIPAAGQSVKLLCPKCGGGSTREQSLSLTIDPDGQGATWKCHRGHCDDTGGGRLSTASTAPRRPVSHQEPPPYEPREADKPDALYEFFDLRGIGHETVDHFGVYLADRAFRDGEQWLKHPCIAFPYRFDGKVVNRKYRGIADKNLMQQEKEPLPTLWNIDAVTADDELIWVEGEPDVMALHEAGYRQVVTLKDGSPDKLRAEDDPARETDKRFAALNTHAEKLAGINKIILAGDDDQPGRYLREELARRLGRHRCWTVEWYPDCKDAGDVLRKFGTAALQHCIQGAEPWPIEGVRRVSGGELLDFKRRTPPATMKTGIRSLDEILNLPCEGKTITITGFPNHGKSALVKSIMMNVMKSADRKFAVFSPESDAFEEFCLQCAAAASGKPARPSRRFPNAVTMTEEELVGIGDWLRSRLFWISSDAEDNPPTVDWVLERGADCVLRHGITDLLIDPFNELDQDYGKLTEHQWIGRTYQRFNAFEKRYGANIWNVAHPQKPARDKNGAVLGSPTGYDISGSAHHFNKSALGVTVHTPENQTQIIVWKSKELRWARKGTYCNVQFDAASQRYF